MMLITHHLACHLPTLAYSPFSPPCLCVYACLLCPSIFSANSGTPIDSTTHQISKTSPQTTKNAKNRPDMSQLSHTLSTARHLDNILAAGWKCEYIWHDEININSIIIIVIIIIIIIIIIIVIKYVFGSHELQHHASMQATISMKVLLERSL